MSGQHSVNSKKVCGLKEIPGKLENGPIEARAISLMEDSVRNHKPSTYSSTGMNKLVSLNTTHNFAMLNNKNKSDVCRLKYNS